MNKIRLLLCAVMALSSCSETFYQVFSIEAENLVYTDNGSPVYACDGLEFTYNFWGENGNVRFIVYNSNDYDVIVDLTRSSFIRNNIAEDYYQGRQYETRIATGVYKSSKYGVSANVSKQTASGGLVNYLGKTYDVALSVGASVGANTEIGTTVKKEWHTAIVQSEPQEVRIPAKSAKAFCTFNINNVRITSDRLKAGVTYDPIIFSKNDSPLEFRNRICIYRENESPNYYDMIFYINEICNVMSVAGVIKPTRFYIPYSSKFEENIQDNNDELFNQSANDKANASYDEVVTACENNEEYIANSGTSSEERVDDSMYIWESQCNAILTKIKSKKRTKIIFSDSEGVLEGHSYVIIDVNGEHAVRTVYSYAVNEWNTEVIMEVDDTNIEYPFTIKCLDNERLSFNNIRMSANVE